MATYAVTHGRFAILHSGVIVATRFDTEQEAEVWARWNYKGPNWEVIELWIRRRSAHPTNAEGGNG
jgi:hypothetical protein